MNVKNLIELLKTMPQDAPVICYEIEIDEYTEIKNTDVCFTKERTYGHWSEKARVKIR